MRRVLRPSGVAVFAVWAPIETHAFADALSRALSRVVPEGPPPFIEAIPHGYHDRAAITDDVSRGGLTCRSIDTVTLTGHAPSAEVIARGFCTGTPLRAALAERGLHGAVEREIVDIMGDGAVSGEMTALFVEAQAPTG